MKSGTKKFSVATFGFSLLCFLLPFVSVSCNQQKVVRLTGYQLVFGATIELPQLFGPPKAQRFNGEPLAAVAFLCCLVALGLSFTKNRGGEITAAALSGLSFVVLLLLKTKLEDDVRQQSSGILQLDYEFGFWFLVLSNILAAALNGNASWRSKGEKSRQALKVS
jgi:hypothetical protein